MNAKIILLFLSLSVVVAVWGILKTLQAPLSLVSTILGVLFCLGIEACIVREAIKKLCWQQYIRHFSSLAEIHISHFTVSSLKNGLVNKGFVVVQDTLDPFYAATGIQKTIHDLLYLVSLIIKKITNHNPYYTIWIAAERQEEMDNGGNGNENTHLLHSGCVRRTKIRR